MTPEIRRILVPVDFSEPSLQAKAMADAFAVRMKAEVRLLHVAEPPQHPHEVYVAHGPYLGPWPTAEYPSVPGGVAAPDAADARQRRLLEQVQTWLRRLADESPQPGSTVVRQGPPIDGILKEIDEYEPDLVVMGTHGWTGLRHLVLGSVAEKVVRLSPVPVLTVHPGEGKEAA